MSFVLEMQALNINPETNQDRSENLYEWPTAALQHVDPIVHEPLRWSGCNCVANIS